LAAPSSAYLCGNALPEQIGMGSGAFKDDRAFFYPVNQQPVRFNVTFAPIFEIAYQDMVLSSKVVTPVKTGVQCFCNPLKSLDSGACPGLRSGVHRNDD